MQHLCKKRTFIQKKLFLFIKICYDVKKSTGVDRLKRKYRGRLLIQTLAIVLPLFLLMTAAVCWLFESNSVNSFLEAQNSHMSFQLNQAENNIFFLSDEMMQWLFDKIEKDPLLLREPVTEEENAAFLERIDKDLLDIDYLKSAPETYQNYVIKSLFDSIDGSVLRESGIEGADILFLMDVTEGYEGMVISEYTPQGQGRLIGENYNIKMSKHSALKELTEKREDKIVFENAEDYPGQGSNYIGYKPIFAKGKVRAVLGIVYNWDEFKASLRSTIIKTMLISISGMIIIMIIMMIFLYRRTIKPVLRMQRTLVSYTKDKSSAEVVRRMQKIKADNELGYLANVISDLALEIDLYTKENTRIAVEREKAETERERAEKEAYEAKVSVMVSQIQPHFMYNALTSIAMMCQIDPDTAQEATITFAKYLRGNMDSLKQTKPVPFEQELEHLKKYLYIEKLRFGKKLNIEYDIQATDFVLPQLSIQPLVENAVKHGVGMKKKGGTVTISTRETESAYEVIISDDGVGFDTTAEKKDDGRSHVGMENTMRRVKDMCGGEIRIESTVGEGTTATVILPKEGQPNENTVS